LRRSLREKVLMALSFFVLGSALIISRVIAAILTINAIINLKLSPPEDDYIGIGASLCPTH
jgi:hypothetical protein